MLRNSVAISGGHFVMCPLLPLAKVPREARGEIADISFAEKYFSATPSPNFAKGEVPAISRTLTPSRAFLPATKIPKVAPNPRSSCVRFCLKMKGWVRLFRFAKQMLAVLLASKKNREDFG